MRYEDSRNDPSTVAVWDGWEDWEGWDGWGWIPSAAVRHVHVIALQTEHGPVVRCQASIAPPMLGH